MSTAPLLVHLQLHVLQDRLGAASGRHHGGGLESGKEFFAVASDFHGIAFIGRSDEARRRIFFL